jgi:hypothetical protein
MKFLKALVNSLLTGLFFSALLALLIMDLNPHLEFSLLPYLQLSLYLTLVYGLIIALICVVAFFVTQFFSGRSLKIAVVSPAFLIFSLTLVSVLAFLIMRENFQHFATIFSPETRALIDRQLITLIFLAALGLVIAFSGLAYPRRIVLVVLFFLIFCGGTAYLVQLRTRFPKTQEPPTLATLNAKDITKRLTIIGMEGLSIDLLITLMAEDKLPNFNFLIDNGSWGTLGNFTPNEMVALDTSFNTGKLPYKHRRYSAWEYDYLNLKMTFPVVPRYIFFKQLTRIGLLTERDVSPPKYVKDMWDIFEANGTPFLKKDWSINREALPISEEAETLFDRIYEDLRFDTTLTFARVKQALCTDIQLETEATQEREQTKPQLQYILLPGLNQAETYFYKYSYPELYGEIDQEELIQYSTVIERYYQYYDEIVGKYLAAKKDDELLVVYSPHGVDVFPMWKRISEWVFGRTEISGYHENAPDGVIFFLGRDIAANHNLTDIHLIDIAPTLLHYLGLPVGKDMDGVVNSSVFAAEFKSEPVLFISSYEEHEIQKQP